MKKKKREQVEENENQVTHEPDKTEEQDKTEKNRTEKTKTEKAPKEKKGKRFRRSKKVKNDQIIRIEELEELMSKYGDDVDPEAIVSMYVPYR